jgi:hypothetical protein
MSLINSSDLRSPVRIYFGLSLFDVSIKTIAAFLWLVFSNHFFAEITCSVYYFLVSQYYLFSNVRRSVVMILFESQHLPYPSPTLRAAQLPSVIHYAPEFPSRRAYTEAFPLTTTMVFCSQCGTQGEGRFCAQCGTPLAVLSQASPTAVNAPSPNTPGVNLGASQQPSQPPLPPQLQESFTALIGSQGQLMPAFHHIVSELFTALDQTIEPKGTKGIEASKMIAFRRMAGKSIPPYYESHVLPIYCKCVPWFTSDVSVLKTTDDAIAAETVPGMPIRNILTWNGWHAILHHKILALPSDTYTHLLTAIQVLGIKLPQPLTRGDLPLHPHPEAAAREQRFQQDIRVLAGTAMQARTSQVNAMAGIMRQGAQNIQMASMPAGSFYYR